MEIIPRLLYWHIHFFRLVEVGAAGLDEVEFAGEVLDVHDGAVGMVGGHQLDAIETDLLELGPVFAVDIGMLGRMAENDLATDLLA